MTFSTLAPMTGVINVRGEVGRNKVHNDHDDNSPKKHKILVTLRTLISTNGIKPVKVFHLSVYTPDDDYPYDLKCRTTNTSTKINFNRMVEGRLQWE